MSVAGHTLRTLSHGRFPRHRPSFLCRDDDWPGSHGSPAFSRVPTPFRQGRATAGLGDRARRGTKCAPLPACLWTIILKLTCTAKSARAPPEAQAAGAEQAVEAQRPPRAVAGAQVQRAGAVRRCGARAVAREAPAGGKWAGGRAALCPALGPWGPGARGQRIRVRPTTAGRSATRRGAAGGGRSAAAQPEASSCPAVLRGDPDWGLAEISSPLSSTIWQTSQSQGQSPSLFSLPVCAESGRNTGKFCPEQNEILHFFFSLEVEGRTVVTLHISAH